MSDKNYPVRHNLTQVPIVLTDASLASAGGGEYAVVDASKVAKAGDTMTGALNIATANYATLLQLTCPSNTTGFRFHTVNNGGWPEPAIEVGAIRFTAAGSTAQFRLLPSGTAIYFQNTASGGIVFTGLNSTARAAFAYFDATKSCFNGSAYHGGTSAATPTALVHCAAGTAAASSAPLKLTAGTNLTTPENGAFEFDGTNLYFTVGGVRKKFTLV